MPLFEYRSADCRKVYEILHLGREKTEEIVCPACGSPRHTKLFSAAAVQTAGNSAPRCEGGECCGGACDNSWK